MDLQRIDLDVLLLVFRHLDVPSLSRLSQTCRALHRIVEQHGWSTLVRGGSQRLSIVGSYRKGSDSIRKGGKQPVSSAKYVVCVDRNWQQRRMIALQANLPPPPDIVPPRKGRAGYIVKSQQSNNHSQQQIQQQQHPSARPMPLLLLTPSSLLLFTRCEVRCWPASDVLSPGPIDLQDGWLSLLTNPNGIDGPRGGSTAYWDISACAQLDSRGEWIALGRANGVMEVIHVNTDARAGPNKRMNQSSIGNARAQSSFVNLAWLSDHAHSTGSPIQSIHSDQRGLVAFGAKNGVIELYKVSFEEAHGDMRETQQIPAKDRIRMLLIDRWSIGKRPWSMWLGGGGSKSLHATWLAVGTMGSEPLLIFPLDAKTHRPGRSVGLPCASGRKIAIHALVSSWPCPASQGSSATPIDPSLLFAGCHDGILRVYDISRILSSSEQKYHNPVYEFQDRFGPGAIFSLALGVGKGGRGVAAGVATHGVVKFFDIDAYGSILRARRQREGQLGASAATASAKRQIVIGEDAFENLVPNGSSTIGHRSRNNQEDGSSSPSSPRCNGTTALASDGKGQGREGVEQANEKDEDDNPDEEVDCEAEGWSLYASGPRGGNSPVYSLVAQHDRLWGVTDSRLCELDLRPSIYHTKLSSSSSSSSSAAHTTRGPTSSIKAQAADALDNEVESRKRNQGVTLAFYRHLDMNLEETKLPPFHAISKTG